MEQKKLWWTGRKVAGSTNSSSQSAQHKEHLLRTYGKELVLTRFPPEPNGHLHLGHAKALFINLMVARQHGGECILRLDDTNPSAERKEYVDQIIENVTWLNEGKPLRVTYSSDYFDTLHEFAIRLIREGKAYVCFQTKEEIKESRHLKTNTQTAGPR
jgi:glutaminyl-tRNA synthetase